jgi:Arsenical resistance operon protein ArsD
MKTIEVFDPAMCCSTGVCGPAVDPDLARFAGDVEWLKEHGASVRRYNLSQEPMAFAQNAVVARALQDGGPECLPLVLVDGQVKAMGAYPARDKLMHWAEVVLKSEEKPHVKVGGCGCGPKGCA